MKKMPALSIRQPYAELILRGKKKIENRSVSTKKRGKVYIYASSKPADLKEFKKARLKPEELHTGAIVGTIEILDCTGNNSNYKWRLAHPIRLQRKRKPKNKPQPIWFYPF